MRKEGWQVCGQISCFRVSGQLHGAPFCASFGCIHLVVCMASTLLRWHHHANVGYAACAFAVPYILMPHHLCHKQKTLFDLHESKAFVAFAGI